MRVCIYLYKLINFVKFQYFLLNAYIIEPRHGLIQLGDINITDGTDIS